jgi:hypothetical protein
MAIDRTPAHHVKAIQMEMLHVAMHQMLPDCMVLDERAKFRFMEQATGGVVAQLVTWLLDGHKKDVRVEWDEMEFPANAWEHVKQDYAPKWFLARWPVKMRTEKFRVSVHHHFVCPHAKVEGNGEHFKWMGVMSGQIGGFDGPAGR